MDRRIKTAVVTDPHSLEKETGVLTLQRVAVLDEILFLFAERLLGLI